MECPKINQSKFHGIINYNEAKEKIFNKALGLPTDILGSVRMSYHKHPTIQFLLKKDIEITTLQEKFVVERKYHSGGELMTDTIHCQIVGMPKSQETINKPYTRTTSNGKQGNETRKNQNRYIKYLDY